MGIFKRASDKSQSGFWKQVTAVMRPGETRVQYAHLRCVSGGEDMKGTLFLTSEQVIWRVADPRVPKGSGFEVRIQDLKACGKGQGVDDPGSFVLGMEQNGQVGGLLFFPQHPKDPASVAHADKMRERIGDARRQHESWA